MNEPTEPTIAMGANGVQWIARLLWVAFGVAGTACFGEALDGRSDPVQLVAGVGLWAMWGIVLVAMLAPSTLGLTVSRLVVASAVPASIAAGLSGASSVPLGIALALGSLASLAVFSAEYAESAAQASAYGAERRFPLRPPAPFLAPMALVWCVMVTCVAVGPLLLAAGAWVVGGVLTVAGVALVALTAPRFHRLSRRWLVLVPAGLVIHDQVVLAETVMLRRSQVAGVSLAPTGTTAHDLSGITWGSPIELRLTAAETIVPDSEAPTKVEAFLVSPSRPGRALHAMAAAAFPVG